MPGKKFYIPRWHSPKFPPFRATARHDRVFLAQLFIGANVKLSPEILPAIKRHRCAKASVKPTSNFRFISSRILQCFTLSLIRMHVHTSMYNSVDCNIEGKKHLCYSDSEISKIYIICMYMYTKCFTGYYN